MKTYLVGGAVRDLLMKKQPKDRDYVVVDGSHDELVKLGYDQVGADFPVYLHPSTGEEYALARRERKTGAGYNGFSTETHNVSIEEDLSRRDLTINSMAIDESERIIDPFGGIDDLKNKILRHTSNAFGEDPLRVIRLARFFARYSAQNFTVAPETMTLAAQMVERGDLNELSTERFWAELEKVFEDHSPEKFFELLFEIGALKHVRFFAEVLGDVSGHRLSFIMNVASKSKILGVPFSVEVFSALMASTIFQTRRAQNIAAGLRFLNEVQHERTGYKVAEFFTRARAYSEGTTIEDILVALKIREDVQGSVGLTSSVLRTALAAARSVSSAGFLHLDGPKIGAAMTAARINSIDEVLLKTRS